MPSPQTKRSNKLEGHIGMFSSMLLVLVAILSFWRKKIRLKIAKKYTAVKHGFVNLQSGKFLSLDHLYLLMSILCSNGKTVEDLDTSLVSVVEANNCA